MTEETEQLSEGLEGAGEEVGVKKETRQQDHEGGKKTAEDIARSGGWKPIEDWEGDPGDWRSAEVFNERGEWIQRHKEQQGQINEMRDSFNSRIEGVNKIHTAQLEAQKAELIQKRNDAIDIADRDAANKHQESIDNLPVVEQHQEAQTVLDSWNASNAWIMQNTPKAAYAKAQFSIYSQTMSQQEAIREMESDISREFPTVAKTNSPHVEGGTKPGGQRKPRSLTMNDLTSEEKTIYKTMRDSWKSEAEFLQAVQDTRSQA